MSYQGKLNTYIEQVQQRLKLGASVRGAAMLTAAALITTVVLVVILNAFGFPQHGLPGARVALIVLLAMTALVGLALPLLRLNRTRSITTVETVHPEFQQRLVTFHEKQEAGSDPFIELLAKDTLSVAEDAPSESLVSQNSLYAFAGVALACVGVLVWMVAAGPGYLGYGASLLWTGPKKNVAPLYDIRVTPGNVAVRRNSDQLITAQVIGLKTDKVQLFAQFKSAKGWEPVAMQPQQNAAGTIDGRTSGGSFQFLFAGLPENVEYYVAAGPITSPHYQVRVVDLPAVKQIHVTYHYPKWTGMQTVSEEHGGDLRALEGTDAELEVQMDGPLRDGMLTLDDGKQVHLTSGEGNRYKGTVHMEKDGAYHVAATDQGESVRLSEDYFISTNKANPPSIAIDRPGRDYRASPIEEVTIGVKAADDFGLNHVSLHYSVNGGAEKTVDLLKQPGAKNADGSVTLNLEDFKMVPGDLVSFYATAKDGHAEARTDITFIQADPFEREFSQSQQGGGGGGGGGGQGQGNQTDISRRQKELIAATWKQQNQKGASQKEIGDAGKFLSDVQIKLREQVLALSGRMQSRDLSTANEEFNSFEKDMQGAATAMQPSADKLKQLQWSDAMSAEQKALQYLLRAEATFRQIQVAFGQQRGGGGGGGGGSAGRDLASLFDLELDTEKNQYETAQTGSAAEERAKQVDDALQKLDALARRQEELAQQQQKAPQTFQERWQQEMLRREAEQLQRQMEQMAQNGQQGQQGGSSGQSSSGQSSGQSQGQQSSQSSAQSQGQSQGQSQSRQAQARAAESGVDPRVQQALNRLREADEQMKKANGGQQGSGQQQGRSRQGGGQQANGQQAGGQQGAEAARRAAEALRQATGLLSGTQQQQASSKLDSLSREADRLSKEERAQAGRIHGLETAPASAEGEDGAAFRAKMAERMQERDRLANDRQKLSDDLSQLERGMRDTARQLAPTQPATASKLRDALGGMDQSDLTNLVQRTADWLRRGINPNSNGTEAGISKGLDQLNDQVRQAQQGMGQGQGKPGQRQGPDSGQQTAELDHVERLRNQIESMTLGRGGSSGQQGRNGQQPGRNGQQQGQGNPSGQNGQQQGRGGQQGQNGQPGQQGGQAGQQSGQQGQNGQPGQSQGQGGQQGQRGQGSQGGQQQGQIGRGGQGGRPGQPGQPGQQGGGQTSDQQYGVAGLNRSGDVGNRGSGGGAGGDVYDNIDTGNSRFRSGPRVIDGPRNTGYPPGIAPGSEQAYRNGMTELNQLRQLAGNDPETLKEVQDLIRAMQRLDPNRFPGNPEMVEQLHTEVLNGVDKLELQLRREGAQEGQVRTDKPLAVPPGYQDAVADYYRRLGKGQ